MLDTNLFYAKNCTKFILTLRIMTCEVKNVEENNLCNIRGYNFNASNKTAIQ